MHEALVLVRRSVEKEEQKLQDSFKAWTGPVFWEVVHSVSGRKPSETWTPHHKACLGALVGNVFWTQARMARKCPELPEICQACAGAVGTGSAKPGSRLGHSSMA